MVLLFLKWDHYLLFIGSRYIFHFPTIITFFKGFQGNEWLYNLHVAILQAAINAVIATAILIITQFGRRNNWRAKIPHFFYFVSIPN